MRTRVPLLGSLIGMMLCATALAQDGPSAWDLYQLGREAEKAGHMAQAYLYYSQAAAQDPKNIKYWQRTHAVATRAALEAQVKPNLPDLKDTANDDSADDDDAPPPEDATYDDLKTAERALPPVELDASAPTRDYDLRGDSKALFTALAKELGVDCVFDDDYTPTQSIHFVLHDVDYRTALHGLEAATGSFIVPVTPKIFMVVKDTPQKRTQIEPRAAVSIPLDETIAAADFNALVTAVQQTLGIEKISFDAETHTVIIRDVWPKVVAARALFHDLMRPRPQVMVDVRFLEVTRDDMLTYGINFPNYFSLTALTNWFNNPVSVSNTITGLLTFGGGKTLIGMGIMMPNLVAQLSKSKGANLFDGSGVGADSQPLSMHFGEHYPVMSAGYFGSTAGTSGSVYTPTPSFTFEDLGLTLKVTPTVCNLDTVTLDVDAEFKALTSQSVNGIPVIANESVKSAVAMSLGEWAVLGGLVTASQAKTITGIAGVTRIPVIGPLTDTHNNTEDSDTVLILLRPRLLSLPVSANGATLTLGIGSETRPRTML